MTVEEALYARLAGYAALTALIGLRIYPLILPESATYPACTYSMIDREPVQAMGGEATIKRPRFQIGCYSKTYPNIMDIEVQVLAALRDFSGTLGGGSGVTTQWIFYDGRNEYFEPDQELHVVELDFTIWHT